MPNRSHNTLLLEGTTPRPLSTVLPALRPELRSAGVWLGSSRHLSPLAAALDLELPRHAVPSFYTALIRCGLHLSRSAHITLAGFCTWHPPFTGLAIPVTLELRCANLPRSAQKLLLAISA